MKISKNQKRLAALVVLIALLTTGTVFSIRRAAAISAETQKGIGSMTLTPSQNPQRYAGMIPDELTPPGDETPVNTLSPVGTPVAAVTPDE
jgi:hypothetical protein